VTTNERTTLYLNRNLIDYLLLEGENVSKIVNQLLSEYCLSKGYLVNIDEEIRTIEARLGTLRRLRKKQVTQTMHENAFLARFKAYLSDGERDIHNIRNWLSGPNSKEYGQIIGHPKDLDKGTIESLVTKAMTYTENEGGNE
jgi:hypothetical protein